MLNGFWHDRQTKQMSDLRKIESEYAMAHLDEEGNPKEPDKQQIQDLMYKRLICGLPLTSQYNRNYRF